MKKNNNFLTSKQQKLLKEANRIFIDVEDYQTHIVLGCYNIIKELFPQVKLPDNSATVGGLEHIRAQLDEYDDKVVYYHYYLGLSYSDISRNIPFTPEKISKMDTKCLQFIWSRAKDFYLPIRQRFISRYHTFLEAIQFGIPSKHDIPIYELGLRTRTVTALYRAGVFNASQMFLLKNDELMGIRGIGTSSIAEITNVKNKLLKGQI